MPAKRKSNGAPVRRASAAELKARKTRASKLETWQKSRDKVMSLVMAQKKAVVKAGGGKWNPEGSAARKREKAARQKSLASIARASKVQDRHETSLNRATTTWFSKYDALQTAKMNRSIDQALKKKKRR